MSSGPEGGVAEVTEGDPVSPAQIAAAEAYARTLLPDDVADAAAQDAVAAFRRSLRPQDPAAPGPANSAQSETLLALSRLMSAVSVPDRSSPADRRQAVWASIGQSAHCTCRESATLLATRANGNIQPRESHALDEHLAGCEDCRALAARAEAADAAFRAALAPPSRGGGVGPLLGAIRRGPALGALAALLAVVIAVVLLASGGSGSNTSRAAVVAPHTQPAAPAAPAVSRRPSASAKSSSRSHRVSHHHARRTVRHHSSAHATVASPPSSSASASPDSSDATSADSTSASDEGASADSNSETASSSATSSAPSAASTPTHATAPSTASQVSGSSSLPAESAPQTGIGGGTSTTP